MNNRFLCTLFIFFSFIGQALCGMESQEKDSLAKNKRGIELIAGYKFLKNWESIASAKEKVEKMAKEGGTEDFFIKIICSKYPIFNLGKKRERMITGVNVENYKSAIKEFVETILTLGSQQVVRSMKYEIDSLRHFEANMDAVDFIDEKRSVIYRKDEESGNFFIEIMRPDDEVFKQWRFLSELIDIIEKQAANFIRSNSDKQICIGYPEQLENGRCEILLGRKDFDRFPVDRCMCCLKYLKFNPEGCDAISDVCADKAVREVIRFGMTETDGTAFDEVLARHRDFSGQICFAKVCRTPFSGGQKAICAIACPIIAICVGLAVFLVVMIVVDGNGG